MYKSESMATYSLRLMLVFLLAALFLNVSNYLFVRAYNAARLSQYKTMSKMEKFQPLDQNYWAAAEKYYDINEPSNNSRGNNSELYLTAHSGFYTNSKNPTTAGKETKNCPELPPDLGPELLNRSVIAKYLRIFKDKFGNVKPGGIYQPKKCKSLQSVAIIIAYRGCKNLLTTFMTIIHPFLMKQQLDYQIFVVEPSNKTQPFNRGKLLNVGFKEATRSRKDGFQCIILHEPHIIPADSRNLYRCSWYPRQLASVVERPMKSPYIPLLGGAVAITPEQFLKLNGFSNAYWGNDADYIDLYNRINASNLYIENSVPRIGKYKTIRRGLGLWNKSEYLSTSSPLYLLDGLTSLSYRVDSFELKHLFTYLQVNIDPVETKTKMYDKQLNPGIFKTTQSMNRYNTTFVNK